MTSDETLSSLRESNCATGTLSTALSCPKEPPERQSLQLRCTLDAIQRDPQTRDAKWARALARRHTDGPLRAALLKTTVRWSEGLCLIADLLFRFLSLF